MMYADVFADIVNVVVFNGERIVDPDDLDPLLNEHSTYFLESGNDKKQGEIHGIDRDVGKVWKQSSDQITIWGLENQGKPQDEMALCVLACDGGSYSS